MKRMPKHPLRGLFDFNRFCLGKELFLFGKSQLQYTVFVLCGNLVGIYHRNVVLTAVLTV